MEFKHEDVTIELNKSGGFVANVAGQRVTKPSLDAMKKFITLSKKNKFEPFSALVDKSYGDTEHEDGLVVVNVTGIEISQRATKYRRTLHKFVIDGRYRSHSSVMVNSPENRAAHIAAAKYDDETDRIAAERKKEYERLRSAIKYVEANDFLNK